MRAVLASAAPVLKLERDGEDQHEKKFVRTATLRPCNGKRGWSQKSPELQKLLPPPTYRSEPIVGKIFQ